MFTLQTALNDESKVPDWRKNPPAYYRAAWIECSELMNHGFDWKWWKAGGIDMDQAKMELVDIWHFLLSMALTYDIELDYVMDGIVDTHRDANMDSKDKTPEQMIEELVSALIARDLYEAIYWFFNVMWEIDFQFSELYQWYLGKNALNLFRQNHGYKEGNYNKQWYCGKEDNYALLAVLNSTDAMLSIEDISERLSEMYADFLDDVVDFDSVWED